MSDFMHSAQTIHNPACTVSQRLPHQESHCWKNPQQVLKVAPSAGTLLHPAGPQLPAALLFLLQAWTAAPFQFQLACPEPSQPLVRQYPAISVRMS